MSNIKHSKPIHLVLALVLALVATLAISSAPAQASHNAGGPQTSGGSLYNHYDSVAGIYVTDDRPAYSYRYTLPGNWASYSNVQGFKSASGTNMINVQTGYVYGGGVWHYMCCNNTKLVLRVRWN
jgi:hypothetical protein